ncbi:MAG: hypothetical protein GX793_03270 [Bacteroidales bacterium]|jgi:hypothetical protein|nr:hypothetical protein [Bacteroidales bacterium]
MTTKIINYRKKTQEFALTKKGTLNRNIKNAVLSILINPKKRRIYPKHYTGSGRYVNLKDYSFYITELLTLQGYKFTWGNDAPRGGKNGDYIQVSKAGLDFILSIRETAMKNI